MVTASNWKGLTKNNHLGAAFWAKPQLATEIMVNLLAVHRGKDLGLYLQKFPTKTFDTDDEYFWNVIGPSRRNIPLVEARHEDGTVVTAGQLAGVGGAPFYVVFAEDWFADGEVIVGERNEIYPLRILGDERMEGTNAVYKVELMGGVTEGMPFDELCYGKRFSWEYAPVEQELSRKVGDIRFTSPVSMRNEWSTIRLQHKLPGSMLNKKTCIGIPWLDKGGKKHVTDMWTHHVEFQFEETWEDYKNNVIMYSRSNRNKNGEYLNFGKSGNVIKMGMGLRQQMEVSNVIYYDVFNLKLLENALYSLSVSKLGMNDRVFILNTGEYGAAQFNKAVLDIVSGWTAFQIQATDLNIVSKTTSPLHQTSLAAGFQFTEYRAPNGVIIKLNVDPLYDDEVRNKIRHPDGGVAMSYRYDIMYIGSMDQPNIQLCKLAGHDELRGYQWGFRNAITGEVNNNFMSFDEDATVMHRMWTGGVMILDPDRTMSLIPNILAV